MRRPDFTLTAGPTMAAHRVLTAPGSPVSPRGRGLADLGVAIGAGAGATMAVLSQGPH